MRPTTPFLSAIASMWRSEMLYSRLPKEHAELGQLSDVGLDFRHRLAHQEPAFDRVNQRDLTRGADCGQLLWIVRDGRVGLAREVLFDPSDLARDVLDGARRRRCAVERFPA